MSRELFNPNYQKALKKDPTLGTPLFDQEQRRAVPPPTVKTSETRNAAFRDVRDSGKLRGMQLRIAHLIKLRGPLTRQEISDITNIPVHSVSARICELHDELGEIEEAGKKLNAKTNKHNTCYRMKADA